MGDQLPTVKVAAVQAASVFLDREATVDRACERIHHARAASEALAAPDIEEAEPAAAAVTPE